MKIREIIGAIERRAALRWQDGFDNSGLQVGDPEAEARGILITLDITEEIVDEAIASGCNLIVSHHPLIFKALKQVGTSTYQQRCVVKAVKNDICIYSAHTSLDNACGGVNHRIAVILGLRETEWLGSPADSESGSGLIGTLEEPLSDRDFFLKTKEAFGVASLRCSRPEGRMIRKVAVCGGAGAFLLPDAISKGADCFVCGEFRYHDYFENSGVLLCELGHYQSEQYTRDLLASIISEAFPDADIRLSRINTNPIQYL